MRRLIYHLALFLLIFTTKTTLIGQVTISARAGMNVSWITSTAYEGHHLKPGFDLSLIAERHLFKNLLDLRLETGISNINSEGRMELAISGARHQVNLDYWTSGVSTGINISSRIKLKGGLQYSHLILARNEWDRAGVYGTSYIVSNDLNKYNWSLLLGAEGLLFTRVSVGIQYAHGLTPVSSKHNYSNAVFNTLAPDAFLQRIRTSQVYLRYKLF